MKKTNSGNGKSGVNSDFSEMEKLLKELSKRYRVEVGVLGESGAYEDGMTAAQIGAVHEFGSKSANIPARSFLRKPIERHKTEIAEEVRAEIPALLANGNVKGVMDMLGMQCQKVVLEAFETQGDGTWSPLSARYKKRPSGMPVTSESKPLMDTGLLRQSITYRVKEK